MIIELDKTWNKVRIPQNGITQISFGFVKDTGTESQRQIVREAVREWHDCNVQFNENVKNPYQADVRITFGSNGCESKIGTTATSADRRKPTMFLKSMESKDELRRHALHEFGHVLGAQHEHFHPDFPYDWNLEAIINQLRKDGFKDPATKAKVDITPLDIRKDKNRNKKYSMSDFDSKSIMIYRIHKDWLQRRASHKEAPKEFKGNYKLTDKDKEQIRKAYST
jgi:hypothetical protein